MTLIILPRIESLHQTRGDSKGRIEQVGTPQEVFDTPRTVFVARFMGVENVCSTTVLDADAESSRVRVQGSALQLSVPGRFPTGAALDIAFRATQVRALTGPPSAGTAPASNVLPAVVRDVVFAGARTEVTADVDGITIGVALLDGPDGRPAVPRPGDPIHLEVPRANISTLTAA